MYFKKVCQRIYSENSIQFPDHSIWSRGQRCPRDQIHLSGNLSVGPTSEMDLVPFLSNVWLADGM